MNFHASASPHICSHAVTSRKPVPLEAGCGITILPLYTGLVRSFQVTGFGRFCLAASTVLKQIVAPHTSIPNHIGGLRESRYCGLIAARLAGAYGCSMPSRSSTTRLVAARPITMSACGLAFSAISLAVMTPVESRTHLSSIFG